MDRIWDMVFYNECTDSGHLNTATLSCSGFKIYQVPESQEKYYEQHYDWQNVGNIYCISNWAHYRAERVVFAYFAEIGGLLNFFVIPLAKKSQAR